MTPEMLEKIKLAAGLSGKKSADVIRLSMELGLRRLEAFGYDIDAMTMAGIEAAEKKREGPDSMPSTLKSVPDSAKIPAAENSRQPDPIDYRGREPVKKPIRHNSRH